MRSLQEAVDGAAEGTRFSGVVSLDLAGDTEFCKESHPGLSLDPHFKTEPHAKFDLVSGLATVVATSSISNPATLLTDLHLRQLTAVYPGDVPAWPRHSK